MQTYYGPQKVEYVGTLPYMPPELFEQAGREANEDDDAFFKACDVWSFGCTLYELMMLKPTFTCTNDIVDHMRLKNAVLNGDFAPLDLHYSEQLRNFTMSCLNRDPTKRPMFISR